MTLAILILQCIMLLFLFVIGMELAKKSSQPNQQQIAQQAGIRDMGSFRDGSQHTWVVVSVSLYKMWTELDILDFDSLSDRLQENLNNLTQNPNEFEQWYVKFKEYMKEKNNGSS